MLTVLVGRAKSGKTSELFRRMQKNGAARKQILIVPEQASFETEQQLCLTNGNQASIYGEVFSFSSLSERIFSTYGGRAQTFLDAGGRMLVMYAALQTVKEQLTVFTKPAQNPEFLSSLIEAVDELKSCCVSPQTLLEIAEVAEKNQGNKLKDLALILTAYEMMTSKDFADPRDKLSRLAEKLKTIDFANNVDVYLDGFTDFTPQEELVLEEFMKKGNSFTVALTCDDVSETDLLEDPFTASRHTAQVLLRMAKKHHIPFEVKTLAGIPAMTDAMRHFETHLFGDSSPDIAKAEGNIAVFCGNSPREEVLWVAGKVRELLQYKNFRYRDIAISARNMAPYQDLISSIFLQSELPLFQAEMVDILQKPIFTTIFSALDTVARQFYYEDIFRYLKSGLSNVSQEECDRLENYVLLWNLRGSQWTSKKGFTFHPRGYHREWEEADLATLEQLNEIRCKVVTPLLVFKGKQQTVKEHALALYSFLEEINLPQNLEEKRAAFWELGESQLAQEYDQLWNIFCQGLEQCVHLLGDYSMDLDGFSRLLALLFSQYHVGAIPMSLDRIVVGELPRLSNRPMKALFLLGADEASLPQITQDVGLLGVHERELLLEYGISIFAGAQDQYSRELSTIYRSCTKPTDCFYATWSQTGGNGSKQQPSFLVRRILQLFSDAQEEDEGQITQQNYPWPLLKQAHSDARLASRLVEQQSPHLLLLNRIKQAKEWKRAALSRESTAALYGRNVSMSASRLDRYQSCHFAYYMEYGLKAKKRRTSSFDAPEYGTFVHFVLEYVLKETKEKGGVKKVETGELLEITENAIETYVQTLLGGLEEQTPRFRFLFMRLKRMVTMVVQNVVEELQSSDFEPLFFELGFGGNQALPPIKIESNNLSLNISGVVDRVDGWVNEGKLYLRVVDYKTGRKSFDLTEIWNGLGLQMLLYIFAMEENRPFFGDHPLVPAGVLYLPARDAVITGSRNMEEQEKRAQIDAELVRRGILLEEDAVLEAMEHIDENGPRFLPLRLQKKTGKLTGSSLVSAEKLGQLKQHIEKVLEDICVEIEQGKVAPNPYWRGESRNACQYCDFRQACHFEEGFLQERRRLISTISNEAFWTELEKPLCPGGDGIGH